MKTKNIIAAYNLLVGSKLTKMSGEGKRKVVNIIMKMKPVQEGFADFQQEAFKRLRPEWMTDEKAAEWDSKGTNSDKLTSIEKAQAIQYLKEVNDCLEPEFNGEKEVSIVKLNDDEYFGLCDSNDWTAGQMLSLMEIIKE